MPHNQCDKVLEAIHSQPWAILPAALDQIIAIASRVLSNEPLAQEIRAERGKYAVSRQRNTAIIPVFGPIFPRADFFQMVSGVTSVESLTLQFDEAMKDPEVEAIVLNFDSPGGQATGIHEFAYHIREASRQKPVTAYVSGMAASAAYWLATATGRMVADRTASVGSIGVIAAWTDDSKARESQGLRDYVIVSSQSPNKYLDPKTPAGRREVQTHLDELAAIFMADVAENRGVDVDAVARDFGQGSVLLAEAALMAGMIDEIGVIDAALAEPPHSRGTAGNTKGCTMLMNTNGGIMTGKPAAGKTKHRAENDEDEDKPEDEEEEVASAETTDSEDSEDDDNDEEEKEEAKAKKLKASHPDVYRAVFRRGIAAERKRIRAIRSLGIVGHKKLVDKAIFDEPMTAAEVSMVYVAAENSAKAAVAKGRLEESASCNVPAALVAPGASSSEASEEAALIRAMAGLK